MKTTISAALKEHLAGEVTTLASCWTITRKDGEIFRFTDHDCDLTVATHDYLAAAGMASTDLKQDRTLSVDNMEAVTFLDSDTITDSDLRARLFDDASVDLFLVNWADSTMGTLPVLLGWLLGRVEIRDNACTAELRGLGQRLSCKICALYSETCRADFGDAQCGVDLAGSGMVQGGSVDSTAAPTQRQRFIAASGLDLTFGRLVGGILTWTGSIGTNLGLSMEVARADAATNEITLLLPMPNDIGAGDEFEVVRGCDKTFDTCFHVFNNPLNFRGEPWVPKTGKTQTFAITARDPWHG